MKVTGLTTWPMARADSFTLMVMSMKGTGRTIKLKATESTCIWTVPNLKDNGEMINKMVWAKKPGRMVLITPVSTRTAKSTVRVTSCGQMDPNMRANSWATISMAKDYTYGAMAENMMDNGVIIKCTAMEPFTGMTVECIRENTSTIRRKVSVNSPGPVARNISVNGKRANNMAKASTFRPKMAKSVRVNGAKARGLDGSPMLTNKQTTNEFWLNSLFGSLCLTLDLSSPLALVVVGLFLLSLE
mmetsp:Transcript_46777/g.53949  ORF Transcript_46777/g.53949 Transcript_46777/m.53949 type:complete len:244 (+) Transcript_46777:580-1311(+)